MKATLQPRFQQDRAISLKIYAEGVQGRKGKMKRNTEWMGDAKAGKPKKIVGI